MFRAAKNHNGMIICVDEDQNQASNYPSGAADDDAIGVWCEWTFDEVPEATHIDGLDSAALRYKENSDQSGIELRSDDDVILSHNGS